MPGNCLIDVLYYHYMKNKTVVKRTWAIDLHTEKSRRMAIYAVIALLALLSLVVRKSLVNFQDPDYQIFSSWYDFIKVHGIHSFKYGYDAGFSNYNSPYNYFLYLAALIPVSKIVAIKGLLVFFDIFMAAGVYFVVKVFRPDTYAPIIAAIATMFIPTVLVTGVMWGQFDQLYVGCVLFSLYFALRGNSPWAWAWFGLAIAVKLQAIFFLPVLGIMVFKRIKWYDSAWAVLAFLVVTLPPMLAGRSLGSLLNIYPAQVNLFNGNLVLNAPTLYQWFPNSVFPYFNHMATGLGVSAALGLLLASLIYRKYTDKNILVVTTLALYLIPFLLPAMHERYFFPAGILSMVLFFVYPTWKFGVIAVSMQVITLFSYTPFLFNAWPPISFAVLSVAVLAIICALSAEYFNFNLLPKASSSASSSKAT